MELAKGTDVGVYPSVFSQSAWMHEVIDNEHPVLLKDDDGALAQFKYDLCTTILRAYGDGADGISTFNWYSHLRDAKAPNLWTKDICGDGAEAVLSYICPFLDDPKAVRAYLDKPWALPPKD
ncbi:MAG: hypothetical protein GY851_34040 [bacterium]|nr:hypothetical protein [bacterium]